MNRTLALFVCLAAAFAQKSSPGLSGSVTDPSGAAIPGALVELRGPGGLHRAQTGNDGRYSLPSLVPGKYQIRISARGFAVTQKKDFLIDHAQELNAPLVIQGEKHVLRVDDHSNRIDTEPNSNSGAVVMRERQIAALSDDPDELALQLQALAGPAPGPNGGQMFVDGFSGAGLPPKSSIREIRINANPFSAEYDQPGFSRIEIFTKPGTDSLHGQAFVQYNNSFLNSRNPLLTQAANRPYQSQFYALNLSGPIRKNRASFSFDGERRRIHENSYILATNLDANLKPVTINRSEAAPQTRTSLTPRIDLAIDPRNSLTVRYSDLRIGLDNQGEGDFNLFSRAYREQQVQQTTQITETAIISARTINETRFQYFQSRVQDAAAANIPVINVQGAFIGGGATVGNSGSVTRNSELTNISTHTAGMHTLKWGGRVRSSFLTDTSLNNFAGTFTFFTLARYQQTLELSQSGDSPAQIAALGAGPNQFSLNAGTPVAAVHQIDASVFFNDDWKVRPHLTLSFGLRYETQTNFGDRSDWAPRVGVAWGLGAKPKTVLRAGAGTFYDRIPLAVTLNGQRYNGIEQQSYLIPNPAFFPDIPSLGTLGQEPQLLQPFYRGLEASRVYQVSTGVERQLTASSKVVLTWIQTRGVHLPDARNINAPTAGSYPFGDQSIRLLTESAGFSRQNQLITNFNVNARRVTLFGYYALSYGADNNEGIPADPYNLRAEWGPSTSGDIRHRMVTGATASLPWSFSLSPFLVVNSGQPFNITTGLDPANTGFPEARPALLSDSACRGSVAGDCFELNPTPGTPVIGRNYGRGPANVTLALRVSRTWNFGGEGGREVQTTQQHAAGFPPASMFATSSARKYALTLTASTMNALNHANFASPDGDLSSPYYGQPRSLGGLIVMNHGISASTYNRKIDLQLRFSF